LYLSENNRQTLIEQIQRDDITQLQQPIFIKEFSILHAFRKAHIFFTSESSPFSHLVFLTFNKTGHFKGTLKVYLNMHSLCLIDKFLKNLKMKHSYRQCLYL